MTRIGPSGLEQRGWCRSAGVVLVGLGVGRLSGLLVVLK